MTDREVLKMVLNMLKEERRFDVDYYEDYGYERDYCSYGPYVDEDNITGVQKFIEKYLDTTQESA